MNKTLYTILLLSLTVYVITITVITVRSYKKSLDFFSKDLPNSEDEKIRV